MENNNAAVTTTTIKLTINVGHSYFTGLPCLGVAIPGKPDSILARKWADRARRPDTCCWRPALTQTVGRGTTTDREIARLKAAWDGWAAENGIAIRWLKPTPVATPF